MKTIEEILPVSVEGTIFDVEAYRNKKKQPITIGYYTGNNVKIYQAESDEDIAEIESIAENASILPKPYYAYNADAEEEILSVSIDHDIFEHFKERCREKKKDDEEEIETKIVNASTLNSIFFMIN